MADFHSESTLQKARKEHRCIYCGGPILAKEQYRQQTGFYDDEPYRNRYHLECFTDCEETCNKYGEWEFTPYCANYPLRIAVIVAERLSNPPKSDHGQHSTEQTP